MPSHNHQQKLVGTTLNGDSGAESTTDFNANIGWWQTMHIHNSTAFTLKKGSS